MLEDKTAEDRSDSGPDGSLTARAFRNVLDAFAHAYVFDTEHTHRAAERRLDAVRRLIDHHARDALWRDRLLRACDAARRGAHDVLLMHFPARDCTDGGHAINVGDPDWPATLSGDAAELYRVWQEELEPKGFGLTARVLDYPHGNLGEVGLFLSWAH